MEKKFQSGIDSWVAESPSAPGIRPCQTRVRHPYSRIGAFQAVLFETQNSEIVQLRLNIPWISYC